MVLLSATAIHPQTAVINAVSNNHHHASATWPIHTLSCSRASLNTSPNTTSSSSSSSISLRHVSSTWPESDDNAKRIGGGGEAKTEDEVEDDVTVSSAAAVEAAIRKASTSPVEFVERIEKPAGAGEAANKGGGLVLPSSDFQRLCLEQLHLFRRIVNPHALLSVYVRPAGSYVMDQLELRRITFYPGDNAADIFILVGNFSVPAGLRAAEAAILSQQVEFFPELRAVVFPMVKHPFVVGFLVAELPKMAVEGEREQNDGQRLPLLGGTYALPPSSDLKLMEIQGTEDNTIEISSLTTEQRLNAINISCSLAMAYVMDQKAMLLEQSSWQNNIRMSNLVEQIHGSLLSIRTLSRMLSVHMKRNEISYDIVEDIIVQGDQMRDTLQQIQDAVYLTKANIMRYNEETLKKINQPSQAHSELVRSQLMENFSIPEPSGPSALSSTSKDLEMPMPPLALAPLRYQEIKPCNVSDILEDLVGAVKPLADKQQQVVGMCEFSKSLNVAVEEPALRQALSNLIEGAVLRSQVGGKVEIVSTSAPAGGVLVIIDDNGPDMHYMTQMHSLTPFGADLLSEGMVEDNMTWNFVASLTVAREILESYGCVVRVISPRITDDAAVGAGGTRVELWLPSFTAASDLDGPAQEL